MPTKNLIVIAGPTAIGKTTLSIAIAKAFNCPVVSADSRQFFKEMNIGNAKPTTAEMQGVPHYFIDSHTITEDYNVGKYENEAIALLEKLFQTNEKIILVGGSGLYIDAICKGFDELPEADTETRNKINSLLKLQGIEGLQELLKELDINYYNKVDLQNPQRLSRALEVCLTTGLPYSTFRKGKLKKRNFDTLKIGLNTSRDVLYNRINQRVDEMMSNGLLNEVKSLLPYKHLNALQTVGYKELFDYLENKSDLQSAIALIKQNTRRFAKRQLTWFHRDEEIKWFEPNQIADILKHIKSESSPKRIISLVPSQTELLYDLGLRDEVVGITKFCIHPDEWFQSKTRVGGTKKIDFETIKKLNPDLIIGNKEENEKEQMEQLMKDYNVWMSDIYTLTDALTMITQVGTLVGKQEEATTLKLKIEAAFNNFNSQLLTQNSKLKTAYFIWRNPFMAAGNNTFINDMLSRCGFTNVFDNLTRYPELSAEQIAAAKPKLILLSSEPYPFMEKHIQEFQSLCPDAKIMIVDGELFSWYGSRLLDAPAYFEKLKI